MNQLGHNDGNKAQTHGGVTSSQWSHEQQQYQQTQSLTEMQIGQKLEEARSALKFVDVSLTEMERFYKEKLHNERYALYTQIEFLKSDNNRLTEKSRLYEEEFHNERYALYQQIEFLKSDNNRLTEKSRSYEEELQKERSAHRSTENEFKSFKDRVAEEVTQSVKKGNVERMNSPVSKSKLKEMYDDLRLQQWPEVKDQLKSMKIIEEDAKADVQRLFQEAADEMEEKREKINEGFRLIESNSGLVAQKVEEFQQSVIQSLQLKVYHSRTNVETDLPQHEAQNQVKMVEKFRHDCRWLSKLMALNNPPLQPDWENHKSWEGSWHTFPDNIRTIPDSCSSVSNKNQQRCF